MFCMLQSGLTPLHLSAQEDRVSAAEVLAKHDANLDQQTKVQTSNHGISWRQEITITNSEYPLPAGFFEA